MSDLLEKVVSTTNIGAGQGGLLNADQTNRFLDYIWDATVLGKQVRKIRMNAPVQEIDKVSVGERIVRGATEAVDTGENAGATFSKISLSTHKLRLDWELSTESLEDNIEGEALEDHLARLMGTQFGNDLEDLAINGNVNSTDPLLKVFNGYSEILNDTSNANDKANVIDANGGVFDRGVINAALKAMPRKYRQRAHGVKFFASSGTIQDYIYSLQAVEANMVNPESLAAAGVDAAVSPEGGAGFITGNAFGKRIQEVPLFREDRKEDEYGSAAGTGAAEHSEAWLLAPENLLWGIKREVKVHREYKPKKDTIEYTVFVRAGVQVQNREATVVVKNLAQAASTL